MEDSESFQSFKTPAFDESLLVSQWLQYNAKHSPDHPLFLYASSPTVLKTITWSEAGRAFARAARIVSSYIDSRHQWNNGSPIGILGNLDTITYNTLFWGIVTAGRTAFLISTRNSPVAVSHLLKQTGTHMLFVSSDEALQNLASSAVASARQDSHEVDLLPAPIFQDLFWEDTQTKDIEALAHYPKHGLDSAAVILHSSGSTAFPKPISLSHRVILKRVKNTKIYGVDLSKHRLAANAMPVYHGLGFFLAPWAACTGLSLTVFPPRVPPMVPSPASVLESAVATKSTFLIAVPMFIEIWSHSADDVAHLKDFNSVLFGGGPLNKAIGDELSKAGVSLICRYGALKSSYLVLLQSTELGPSTMMVPKKPGDLEWDWFQVPPHIKVAFLPQESDSDLFELVYLTTPNYAPAVINTEVDGNGGFATSDLVIRHPADPTKFKIYGRKDDQIMLSTGEKTNPGPMDIMGSQEAIICRHPSVQYAVIFGRGRRQNGIIVQPAKGYRVSPMDTMALAQFRNEIWPSIEQANEYAPSHSRIYKEMILVTHPSKPFELTAKHTPRRPVVMEAYKNEIAAVYDAVDESSQIGVAPPAVWAVTEVHEFVRKVVLKVMGKEVADDDDIFQHGGDSLKATYIRNSIVHAVRETTRLSSGKISQDFVYAHPCIARLSAGLLAIGEPSTGSVGDLASPKLKEMLDLISEFSVAYPKHQASTAQKASSGEVVLLTGSTGGLGTQLLSHLTSVSSVSHVYAFNRAANDGRKSLRDRQAEALLERGLDVEIVNLPKVTLVEGDIAIPDFGIDSSLFEEIRDTTTLIIHNAWRVNFNLALSSFKPIIRGVRNLVDLALQSPHKAPPRFVFTGSVGVFRNWKARGQPLEAPIKDPALVQGSGYSESKFVGEQILENAAKCTPLRPIIVRIGQMTSNSSGAWNSGDWLPAIVRSGQVLGVLPARDDFVAWISLDIAARAIVDFGTSDAQYLHLAHPCPVPWNTVFEVFSSLLKAPLVSWTEWLSKLEKDDSGPESNPALHLLDFFRRCPPTASQNRASLGVPLMDMTEALKHSPTLSDPSLPQVVGQDVERWVAFWRRSGFLAV